MSSLGSLSLTFGSKEQIIEYIKTTCAEEGVYLSIKTSTKRRVVLKCDRGGNYTNRYGITEEERKRQTKTRLVGCSFEIVCSLRKELWAVRKGNCVHNHDVSLNPAGHSIARRPTEEEKKRFCRYLKME